jgi:membrane dipeptidase
MTEDAMDHDVSRRSLFALAAAGSLAPNLALAAAKAAPDPLHGMLVINALGGLENPNIALSRPQKDSSNPTPTDQPDIDARTFAEARSSGVNCINVTLGYVSGPQEPFEYTMKTIGIWDEVIRTNPQHLLKVYTTADILRAKAERKIGLIYGFQNALQVGDRLERVDIFGDLGVRVIQLTYNPSNTLGDGSMAPENRGLTPLGRKVVERLNEKRIMVDLSHSGEQTCLDAIKASKAPISINHTGCRALVDLPRNKTDAELRGVAEKGGFVGIYFMPFLTLDGHPHAEDVVTHIDHAVNVCGEDHVGIGTDGSVTGIDDLQGYQSHLAAEIEARRKAGVGATGERPDTYPFVADLRGEGQFRKLAAMLRAKGYREARIEKIMGRNFLRYARDIWGA